MADRRVVALAGGVGGAKLAHGLQSVLDDPSYLSVIVNTGDDFDLYGLRVCPDLDTVMYTLAGLANPVTGWGIQGDTFATLEMIERYTSKPWFLLGDRDIATHIVRTERLRAGQTLSQVTHQLSAALGVQPAIVPMTEDRVATLIDTPEGRLDFQQYFVAHQHRDVVTGVHFAGAEEARPCKPALSAIETADVIILCPSNPIVSIGPILTVPGIGEALATSRAPKVAVSPIIGGNAVKGPAAQMLQTLGHEVSPLGIARLYQGIINGLVIDHADAHLATEVEALSMSVLVTDTLMTDEDQRAWLARATLGFATSLTATPTTGRS